MSDGKSEGPYRLQSGTVEDSIYGPGFDKTYGETINCDGAPERFVEIANTAWHSRDAEVDALRKENYRLVSQRDFILKTIACQDCGKRAFFVCSLGGLNCAECGEQKSWSSLGLAQLPGTQEVKP